MWAEAVMKIAGHIIKQNIRVIVHDVSQWKPDITALANAVVLSTIDSNMVENHKAMPSMRASTW